MNQNNQGNKNQSEEILLKDLVDKIKSGIRYVRSKWVLVFAVSILGALLGLVYSMLKKPTYTAVCTFVLEDAKTGGGLGQYASLTSLAGINIGGGSSGIFEGDNILELYKSRSMIEKALLGNANFDGKNQLLIERFIDSYNLRAKWKANDNINNINFNGNSDNFDRKQDSLITDMVELFDKKLLDVSKPDKKLSIIRVEVVTKDELFSKYFNEKLVQTVNDFYTQTKTKQTGLNVRVLQRQVDSVRLVLNSSLSGVASANDADPYANPLMSTLRVNSQKRQIDVQANSSIYDEMVKNLELAKISFRQEMPLIQVIDKPVLPLKVDKIGKIKGGCVGLIVGFIFGLIALTLKTLFGYK